MLGSKRTKSECEILARRKKYLYVQSRVSGTLLRFAPRGREPGEADVTIRISARWTSPISMASLSLEMTLVVCTAPGCADDVSLGSYPETTASIEFLEPLA